MIEKLLNRKGFSFTIDAFTVRVRFSHTLPHNVAGDYSRKNGVCEIRLDADLEHEDLLDTFFHEFGHLINDVKLAIGPGPEPQAQALGSAVHQLWQAFAK